MSGRRFYELTFKASGEPVYFEHLGHILKISGVIVQGMSESFALMLPGSEELLQTGTHYLIERNFQPTLEEWSEILRRLDDPVYFAQGEEGHLAKVIHRKQQYGNISGAVQQKIWARDNFQCLTCGKKMGDVQLTVDHWIPLELGGENNETNYISMCRKCNKYKGNIHPEKWCVDNGLEYELYVGYLNKTNHHSPDFIADRTRLGA